MSASKNRSERRRIALLQRVERNRGVITINHLGGISRHNPELVRLVRDGYMEIPLNRGTPTKWSKEFPKFFPLYRFGIHGYAPRLRASITVSGRQWLQSNKHLE